MRHWLLSPLQLLQIQVPLVDKNKYSFKIFYLMIDVSRKCFFITDKLSWSFFYFSASLSWIRNTGELKIFSFFSVLIFIEIITFFQNLGQNCAMLRIKSILSQLTLAFDMKKFRRLQTFQNSLQLKPILIKCYPCLE